MTSTKEVAKVESGVSQQLPEFIKGAAGAGTEALSSNAVSPPRLKLIQALSPELEEHKDLKPGSFFNNVLSKDYGSKVKIIPCFLTEAYFLFAPRVPGSAGGLLARANDGVHWNPPNGVYEVIIDKKGTKTTWKTATTVLKSGLAAWGTSDPSDPKSPPAATFAINCVVLLRDHMEDGPMVLSFMRSAIKVATKFAGSLKMSRVPAYGRVFDLSGLKVDGPSGPYYEPRLSALGFIDDINIFNESKEIYMMARERGVEVDIETVPTENGNGSTKEDDDKVSF